MKRGARSHPAEPPAPMPNVSGALDTHAVGLLRRLGSMIYDGLLLLAIWMVLGLVFVWLGQLTALLLIPVQFATNLVVAWAFFFWFWTHTGQTLGMQTWNLRLRDEDGRPVNPWRATLRYLVALAQWLILLFGIYLARGNGPTVTVAVCAVLLFALGLSQLHPQRLMLHDWLSGTRLVRVPKQHLPRWRQQRNEPADR